MNNSISLEDVSIIYTHPPVNVIPEHTTAIYSQCWTGSEGDTHTHTHHITSHCVLWSEKLTAYLLRNSIRSCTTLVLMYI